MYLRDSEERHNISLMPDMLSPVLEVLPTRVRRNYRGGALLEQWTGEGAGIDGNCPEDWIASTTAAINPGLPFVADEGLTMTRTQTGCVYSLSHLLSANPAFYLGEDHLHIRGADLGFLAKLLDSAIRLHVQAHPTAALPGATLDHGMGNWRLT